MLLLNYSLLALLIDLIRKQERQIMRSHVYPNTRVLRQRNASTTLFEAGQSVFVPSNTNRGCVAVV